MRHTTAYFLFLIYTTILLGQVVPILSDALSHTFAKAIHIATVHARYGSNHLGKELENTNQNSNKNNSTKSTESFEVHILAEETIYNFYQEENVTDFISCNVQNLPAVFISTTSPPPKFPGNIFQKLSGIYL